MYVLKDISEVQKKIRELEEQQKILTQKLEKVETLRKEGQRYYQGTELLIDDVIFSLREGQAKSVEISLDFYRKTLYELDPLAAPVAEPEGMPVQ